MKIRTWISLTLPIFIILINATQAATHFRQWTDHIDSFINKTLEWISGLTKFQKGADKAMNLSTSTVLAGVFCFIAASISSAGGVGGGGLFLPILTIVAGLDLKTASSFSEFMIIGVSVANVMYYMGIKSYRFGGKTLIDYDIALLSEPCMLLGVSVGVICNLVLPEWLITILFAVFLVWSTFKTYKKGLGLWKIESDQQQQQQQESRSGCENQLENGLNIQNETCGEMSGETESLKEPLLLGMEGKENSSFPWKKLVVSIMIWFSFFAIYLLRGNSNVQGIIPMKPCGIGYWTLSLSQIPLAIAFTAWILRGKEAIACQGPNKQEVNTTLFPLMALLAGGLGGVFGIGGGMLISPLLLQVGIAPEVTSATCSFIIFFASTMSALQYLLLGMEHTGTALVFMAICFAASLLGLVVVQKAIKELGRASLIVLSLGIVMALSAVLMTTFGALAVWEDYSAGNYMGFKPLC